MSKPFVVGITGCSGSGKTYFLKKMLEYFSKDEICLISQDNYYIPRDKQPVDQNGIKNFDSPDSIDLEEYLLDIIRLIDGETVNRQEYTYNNPDKMPETIILKSAPIILAEGIFVFSFEKVSRLFDFKIFIEAKDHVRLTRRIVRDNEERGYDLDDVLYRYRNHVIPTYEKYIEPFRSISDIIIPNNDQSDNALEVLVAYLKSKMQ